VRPILIAPLPKRPVVQHPTPSLLARPLELVLGHIPIVTKNVEGVHLVVDLVGAGGLGPQGQLGLVDGRRRERVGLVLGLWLARQVGEAHELLPAEDLGQVGFGGVPGLDFGFFGGVEGFD
jgi:hypothetical protein